jgi:hypothetical protein
MAIMTLREYARHRNVSLLRSRKLLRPGGSQCNQMAGSIRRSRIASGRTILG